MEIINPVRLNLPDNVKRIIQVLSDNGYGAYAVGGCVRDSLIGREPEDWDITTSALPQQVKALFPRTIDTGIQHGTVTVMIGKTGYEITTYRLDGIYEDSRHPKDVEFTPELTEDLKRRDFTVNAMAYSDSEGLVDIFGGVDDLKRGIIRCVGTAEERFGEDALRMLRAVRFCAQLGFAIEEQTAKAVGKLAPSLEKISRERIHAELNKMLKSPHPEYFLLADELGIMEVILPEFHALSRRDKELAGIMAQKCACGLAERYGAMLLHIGGEDAAKAADMAANVLKELKMDNATISMTAALVRWHAVKLTEDEGKLRHIIHAAGQDRIIPILRFRLAFEEAKEETAKDGGANGEVCRAVERQIERCRRILDRGDCLDLKSLSLTGKELMALGIPAGPGLGDALDKLLDAVLTDQSLNSRETLLEMAKKYIIKKPLS